MGSSMRYSFLSRRNNFAIEALFFWPWLRLLTFRFINSLRSRASMAFSGLPPSISP